MEAIKYILLATVSGAVGWALATYVTTPFAEFRKLRREVSTALAEYGNVPVQWRERRDRPNQLEEVSLSEVEIQRIKDAASVFRTLASQMRGFAETERVTTTLLAKVWRQNALDGSRALLGFANTLGSSERRHHRAKVAAALKLPL